MSHTLQISGEAYRALQEYAARHQQPMEAALEALIVSASTHYYETEDWFRHLGMTEDEIREVRERADREDADS
jgi:hypothetical protein